MDVFIFKNIVIINDFGFINGGAGRVAISSAVELASRGFNVIFFSAVAPFENELLNIPNLKLVSTFQKDILSNSNKLSAIFQGLWNSKASQIFKSILDNLNSLETIIHIHSWTKAISSSFLNEAYKKNFKIILTVHDYFLACPNGGFYNYQKEEICHLRPLSPSCILDNCDSRNYFHKIWRVTRQFIQNKAGGIPNKISNYIFVSNFSYFIIKEFLPKDSRIFFLENPITIDKVNPTEVSKNRTFLYIGRFAREKGISLLAQVAKKLNLCINFIGKGELESEIKNIYPKATITPWVNQQDIFKLLRSGRALIFPSLWYETQGLVITEAASLGVPSIVSSGTAASEFIKDGQTGFIFARNDASDLSQKIKLLQNDQLIQKLGQNAYTEFWKSPPSIIKHVSKLIKIYENVLRGLNEAESKNSALRNH